MYEMKAKVNPTRKLWKVFGSRGIEQYFIISPYLLLHLTGQWRTRDLN